MAKFEVKIDKQSPVFKVKVLGIIDEDVDFNQFSLSGSQEVHLDLEGVKNINSCGIREWIKWVGGAGSVPVVYENCPKVIVDQINMVDGFLPAKGRVNSFFVPYYNEDEGSEKNVLFRRGTEFNGTQVQAPGTVKDEKGNPMEMDVIEAKYFKFLSKGV